jgi:hypothetical protein
MGLSGQQLRFLEGGRGLDPASDYEVPVKQCTWALVAKNDEKYDKTTLFLDVWCIWYVHEEKKTRVKIFRVNGRDGRPTINFVGRCPGSPDSSFVE